MVAFNTLIKHLSGYPTTLRLALGLLVNLFIFTQPMFSATEDTQEILRPQK